MDQRLDTTGGYSRSDIHGSYLKNENNHTHHDIRSVYTQVDLVSNALYIYVVLLFTFIVVGVIIYGVREYILAFKNRMDSPTSEKLADMNWTPEEKSVHDPNNANDIHSVDLEDAGSYNRKMVIDDDDRTINSIASSVPFIKLRNISQKSNKTRASLDTESNLMKEIDDIKKIEIIYDEINSGETGGSITQYLVEDFKPKSRKKVYSFEQLNEIKHRVCDPKHIFQINKGNIVKMSELLRFSVNIPPAYHLNTFQNNKIINEIKCSLIEGRSLDLSSKSILILKLVSMGVNQENPNYFLNSFNETIEFITDTGIIFELIEKINNEYLKVLLTEMVLNYCYEHWNFNQNDKFDLIVQSRITIFRILCNMKLGISSVENLSPQIRNYTEFKVQTVFRELTRRSHCNDYLEMIPMVSQAVAISHMNNLKYLFYNILFIILKNHGPCCMRDYLKDKQTDLKALIQHGFWYKNDRKIIDKTNEIFNFLVQLNSQIYSWYSEISEGKIFVSSAVNSSGLNKHEPTIRKDSRLNAPGGWN